VWCLYLYHRFCCNVKKIQLVFYSFSLTIGNMKIGIDIHGCIDLYPEQFRELTHQWAVVRNHEVHILTGQSWEEVRHVPEEHGIVFTHHFSIVDWNLRKGTPMWNDDPRGDGWWMNETSWLISKGVYCKANGLYCLFDDSPEYGQYMPKSCCFIVVPKEGFERYYHAWLSL